VISAHVGSALRRSARIAVERPRIAAWTLVAATCALFVAGAAMLAADNVERWSAVPHAGGGSMVVYLGDGVDDAHARVLATQLAAIPGVERAELVPAAESAQRLQRALGADAALLDGVDLASLPASVEVTLAPGVRDVIAMSPTLRALRGTPGVDDVVVEAGGADTATGALDTMRVVAWSAAVIAAVLACLILLAAVRIRLARDHRERAVLDLLGAPPAFTLVPGALAGALVGIAAALLATFALWLCVAHYGDAIAHALAGMVGAIDVSFPAISAVALFVALGAALGAVGGGLAGVARDAR
jgi:cell division protein FtsX